MTLTHCSSISSSYISQRRSLYKLESKSRADAERGLELYLAVMTLTLFVHSFHIYNHYLLYTDNIPVSGSGIRHILTTLSYNDYVRVYRVNQSVDDRP